MPRTSLPGSPAAPRSAERLSHRVSHVELPSDKYGTIVVDDRTSQLSLAGANLVGSLTTAGTHAPALDVDHPAELVRTGCGLDLWVDAPLSWRGYLATLRALRAAGLAGQEAVVPRSARKLARRRGEWSSARASAVDDSSRQEVLRSLGPELTCSFDGAVLVASATTSQTTRVGREMRNPWRFPLTCEAMLVPSTSNLHLYLEVELGWASYETLLSAMVEAGLVQPGYLGASRARESTYLRLPWVSKSADGSIVPPGGVDLDDPW